VQIGTDTITSGSTLYSPIYRFSATSTTAAAKSNIVFTASELAAAGIPSGATITAISFHKKNAANFVTPASFSVYMGNTSNAPPLATTTTWASILASHTPVYSDNAFNIPLAAGWVTLTLTTPFVYTGGSLEIATELSMTGNGGATDNFAWEYTPGFATSCLGVTGTGTTLSGTTSSYKQRPNIQITFYSAPCSNPPVAGTVTSSVSAPVCPGTPVNLGLSGNSLGTGMTFEWESSPTNTPFTPTSLAPAAPVPAITITPTATRWYRAKVTCSNGTPVYSPAIQVEVSPGLAGGTYTINNTQPTGGTNFNSFADAIAAMNCGITGPVVFNVAPASGPYVETVSFGNIAGTSPTNTIRINGNGRTVQFNNTSANRQLLTLDGTRYLTIDSLTFKALNATYGWGAMITNDAAYDSIVRCDFDLSAVTSTTAANVNGIAFTASTTSASSSGLNGRSCYIAGNHIFGPNGTGGFNYGISIASGGNDSNIVRGNIIENYYNNGIYISTAKATLIEHNIIHKANKTASVAASEGILTATGDMSGSRIIGNRIYTPAGTAASTAVFRGLSLSGDGTAAEPVIVANNLIYDMNQGGASSGIYISSALYNKVYHNTVSLDRNLTGTSANYGIYATGTNTGTEIKNNNVSITAGTLGVKYGFYYNSAASIEDAQRNNIYVNSTQSGTQNYGYYTTAYATQAAFQAAYPTLEVGSTTLDPQFASPSAGDFTPGNVAMFGTGADLSSVVTNDILGTPRSNMPTPGAYELTSTAGNDAGVLALASPSGTVCSGSQPVAVTVMNGGMNVINNVQIHWTVNGVAQPVVNYSTPIYTLSHPAGNTATVPLGNVNFTTAPTTIRAWTYLPNGNTDTVNTNDTLEVSITAALSGTLTVNAGAPPSATNYQDFTTLANDLNTFGVCGPVTVNVVAGSGPYNEVVKFTAIPGTSPVNKVRINGNGNILQFDNTSANRQLVTLDGTQYLTIDSLTIKSLNATYGWGVLITNGAAYDSITRCFVDLTSVTSVSTANVNGIVFSASTTSASTAGLNGRHCFIGYNHLKSPDGTGGMNYGVGIAAGGNDSNIVRGNIIENYYNNGVYVSTARGTLIEDNIIHRTNKTASVVGADGIGTATGDMSGSRITGNRIYTPAGTTTNTGVFRGLSLLGDGTASSPVIVANNLVYDMNQGGASSGIYLSSALYNKVYHNTVSLDRNLTGTSANYGIYATGTNTGTEVINNNVSITAGTLGIKYGFYYSTAASIDDAQRNNIYVNSSQAGVQNYGYYASAYATRADFVAAHPTLEVGSLALDPQFIAPLAGNFMPGNYQLVANGLDLSGTVPTDINGAARLTTPTPGAYEVLPTGTDNAASVSILSPKGSFCAGQQPVRVSVLNAGTNDITTMKIHWQLNGVDQPVFNYTSTLNPISGPGQFLDTVYLGDAAFAAGTPVTIKVWTYLPNNNTDIANANDSATVTLEASVFTIDAVADTLCLSGGTAIHLSPDTGYQAGNLTWQSSADGLTWSDVANSDVISYNALGLTSDTFFRVRIHGGTAPCYSDSVKILVVDPQLLSSNDSARCGPGTLFLRSEANTNALLKWYDDAAGTTLLGTGTYFETPFLSATDTFYVSAGIGSPSTCETPLVPVVATIHPVPDVQLGNDVNECVDEGYQHVLDAGSHPHNVTYLWDDNSVNMIRAVNASGTYHVSVTNEFGCAGSDTVKVTLRPNPVVALGNDTVVCNGVVLNLDAGNPGSMFYWSTGENVQSIEADDPGTYWVFVSNDDGCAKSDTITITSQGLLPSTQGIQVTNNGQHTFQFSVVNPQNITEYDWDFGDGSPHSFLPSPTHTYQDEGTYSVVLKISSTCGFVIDTSASHIVVGINRLDIGQEELTIYPNPAATTATILNKGNLKMEQVLLYNMLGQVLLKQPADGRDKHTIDLAGLPAGMYTIQIFTDKGTVSRKLEILK